MVNPEFIKLKIKRRKNPTDTPYWEEFNIPYRPNMNIVSVLMEVRKHPQNAKGETVDPVVWECNCLEEVCGACSMLINGVPRQACAALTDKILEQYGENRVITLEPLSKFPVIRDLMIDRQQMFENLKRVKAWVPVDGSWAIGRGPRLSDVEHAIAYPISRCMTCGCCYESCPNCNSKSQFVGPFAIAQVRLFNMHAIGRMHKDARLKALTDKGGIQECGNSQNCKRVCPKHIKLTDHIAAVNRQANGFGIRDFLTK
jgi:succinate dehydrogenase / fumarate reductase iron-sulfur subunit